MKKGMFGIYRINEHRKIEVTPVNGYILDYGVFRFGIRKQWNQWSVTELSTGMLTGIFTSRKKDIIPMLEEKTDLLEFINKKINSNDLFIKTAKEKIREFYTTHPAE